MLNCPMADVFDYMDTIHKFVQYQIAKSVVHLIKKRKWTFLKKCILAVTHLPVKFCLLIHSIICCSIFPWITVLLTLIFPAPLLKKKWWFCWPFPSCLNPQLCSTEFWFLICFIHLYFSRFIVFFLYLLIHINIISFLLQIMYLYHEHCIMSNKSCCWSNGKASRSNYLCLIFFELICRHLM